MVQLNKNNAIKKIRQSDQFSRLDDKKIKQNDHLDCIDHLMKNDRVALRLHLDNLCLTYGFQIVVDMLEKTKLEIIKNSKKAG